MVEWFIKGGLNIMIPILGTLIIGLVIAFVKLVISFKSRCNAGKLMQEVKKALLSGNDELALKLTKGSKPLEMTLNAAIRMKPFGMDHSERALTNEGGLQAGSLESGMVWMNLMIALAPMLGFLGTVWGMVEAMDAIAKANDVSPSVVASGISVALITTMFGLIVAIILQTFQNVIASMTASIVGDMEESGIAYMELLMELENTNKK